MEIINNINGAFRRIRARLSPNYMPNTGHTQIAKPNDETPDIEQLCEAAKNRGSFSRKQKDLVKSVRKLLDEVSVKQEDTE